ncbi:expressed unknown protein [Seminavis robusta]|uniref:CRAL-TRIO domain-containing protein n=1 Tax=Seminavis robusta TaxID=568900 RepID=A0A9N8EF79_9STRA|nr:expressed unknown protein [Seminavis robusta]|eukprot:Sro1096_g240740.1 n/a (278) ;mRNA; f:7871-8704
MEFNAPIQIVNDMMITERERNWALAVKEAVELSTRIDNISDFGYAHHCIAAGGDLNKALDQIEGMQAFRKQYNLSEIDQEDTIQRGLKALDDLNSICPNWLLHVDLEDGSPWLVCNQGQLNPGKVWQRDKSYASILLVQYYLGCALQPTLQAVREGTTILTDGEKMSWEMIDMNYQQQLYFEFVLHFPHKVRKILVFNANCAAVAFWNLVKPFLPRKVRRVVVLDRRFDALGFRSDEIRCLTDLFCQPNREESWIRCKQRVAQLLVMRSYNNQFFRL